MTDDDIKKILFTGLLTTSLDSSQRLDQLFITMSFNAIMGIIGYIITIALIVKGTVKNEQIFMCGISLLSFALTIIITKLIFSYNTKYANIGLFNIGSDNPNKEKEQFYSNLLTIFDIIKTCSFYIGVAFAIAFILFNIQLNILTVNSQ